tara:strand:- start:2056 stop:3660 length:1605 start_codon:yes stop_codon:yes gene_type:complete
MTKSINEVGKELQAILDEVGISGFPRAKALYLKDMEVLDEDGNPVDPEELEIEIARKETGEYVEPVEEEEEEEKAIELEEEDEEAEDKDMEEEQESRKPSARAPGRGGTRKPTSGRHPRTGKVDIGRGGGGGKNLDEVVAKAVSGALGKNKVRLKGHDMRIDNEREGMKRWGSLKHISRIQTADPELEAYKFGRWAAACMGHKKSVDWCANRGIVTKAHVENVNSAGGFLVPEEFSDTLISLREEYGVFRRNAQLEPMASDTKRIPKRSATLTASFVGEATAGTETTQTFQQVNLVAKKLMVLTTISNELNEDSLINLGDSVAGEIAYAFAKREDECGFIGDGSSTYGGIVGAIHALNDVTSNAGVATADSAANIDTLGELALSDILDVMALLPNYADSPNCKWYMHKSIYAGTLQSMIYEAGGTSARERAEGVQGSSFLGYPVEFVQVMPSSSTADGDSATPLNYPILFGDLRMAAAMGDRRQNTISFSDSALNAFEQDEIVVRGTERFDINFHSPGTSSEAGPLVALKLATS